MDNKKKLDTYEYLLINNARCMGFLHGIADVLANKSDVNSKHLAQQIFTFLVDINDNPQVYYCERFQFENLKKYKSKLQSINSDIASTLVQNLIDSELIKQN